MNHRLTLSNGYKMPIVGLGTINRSDVSDEEMESILDAALEAGYRHFDTAYYYDTEKPLGKSINRWIQQGKVKREELWITTKLPMIGMTPKMVPYFMNKSLENLELSYIDLYLVHTPWGYYYLDDNLNRPTDKNGKMLLDKDTDLIAVWKAMEEQADLGKAKCIGISNFNTNQVERIVKAARIQPVINQVEMHVHHQQKELRSVCAKHGIMITAYGVLGSPERKPYYDSNGLNWGNVSLLDDPIVKRIADKKGKSPGQILLRFLVQQGIIVIPKSGNPKRIKENILVLEFELLPEEMKELGGLDKGEAGKTFLFTDILKGVDEHPEYPLK